MKKVLLYFLALVGIVAVIAGSVFLWSQRPWRIAVSVNGHGITAGELEMRAQTLLDDAKRMERLLVPKGREAELMRHYRREAAKMWIVKEVLLAEAAARGTQVTPEDEKNSLVQVTARLKARNLSPDQFFKEGPLPEELKRRDFREGVLINKFTTQEVADKIIVKTEEINERVDELKKLSLLRTKPGEKSKIKTDRKTAVDMLHAERFRSGFRRLFRELYKKAIVKSPMFPDLETIEGVSPARAEDGASVKPAAAPKRPASSVPPKPVTAAKRPAPVPPKPAAVPQPPTPKAK